MAEVVTGMTKAGPVVDVHTHMLSEAWLGLLEREGGHYRLRQVPGGQRAVTVGGAPFMTLTPGMLDYDMRIRAMDAAGVDIAIVSLTCPNAYFGDEAVSTRAARLVNDDMADAQTRYPGRIRFLASLPWQYPEAALRELERAAARGAVGVMVLANIAGASLTEERFAAVWAEIDRRRLPVLVHPSAPPGVEAMDMSAYNLVASLGFAFDTTLAIGRMVLDGFLDRYPHLSLIAAHGGGALPFLKGRLDQWHKSFPACRERITEPPSAYLGRLYYDAVVYTPDALDMCLETAGAEHVLYGSDYPHNVGDMAGCLARVDGLGAGDRARVRGENAVRLFGL
jgi:aminocarboxymuconate-semialdehyde decarboxylase